MNDDVKAAVRLLNATNKSRLRLAACLGIELTKETP